MTEGNPAGVGLRERKKGATRAALVAAAVRPAAEHGSESVTVDAISEAAGCPRTPAAALTPSGFDPDSALDSPSARPGSAEIGQAYPGI